MQIRTSSILTAVLLIAGALLANIAFVGLGSAFEYPDILQSPTNEIFQKFTAHEGTIKLWFVLLAVGAGLLAPIAILVGRQFPGKYSRLAAWFGIVAALVQVVGLLRWPLLVPGLIARGDASTFELAHKLLGTIVGETLGYLFTALWTFFVLRSLDGRLGGAWFNWFGIISAGLILLGILVPLGVPGTDLANFVGYVLWSIWLIAFAIFLLLNRARGTLITR